MARDTGFEPATSESTVATSNRASAIRRLLLTAAVATAVAALAAWLTARGDVSLARDLSGRVPRLAFADGQTAGADVIVGSACGGTAMRIIPIVALALYLAAGLAVAQSPSGGQETVYRPGNGVTVPKVVKEVKPAYTAQARRAGIQGVVGLECVVEKDGHPDEIRVTKALDPGLDEEAVKALRLWRFEPGRKDGNPVRVRIEIEMTFTLR